MLTWYQGRQFLFLNTLHFLHLPSLEGSSSDKYPNRKQYISMINIPTVHTYN